MKKQDYTTLAKLVKNEIDCYRNMSSGGPRIDTLTRLMCEFSECAHVDKRAFLKACGVE